MLWLKRPSSSHIRPRRQAELIKFSVLLSPPPRKITEDLFWKKNQQWGRAWAAAIFESRRPVKGSPFSAKVRNQTRKKTTQKVRDLIWEKRVCGGVHCLRFLSAASLSFPCRESIGGWNSLAARRVFSSSPTLCGKPREIFAFFVIPGRCALQLKAFPLSSKKKNPETSIPQKNALNKDLIFKSSHLSPPAWVTRTGTGAPP